MSPTEQDWTSGIRGYHELAVLEDKAKIARNDYGSGVKELFAIYGAALTASEEEKAVEDFRRTYEEHRSAAVSAVASLRENLQRYRETMPGQVVERFNPELSRLEDFCNRAMH